MLFSLVLICLIGAVFSVPTQEVPYFAGRSANIIVQPKNAVNHNSAILLHGKQFESQLKAIEDINVADLFAHVMGTQPFNVLAKREGFPKGDLFQKPKAALLVTLDSIAPELFAKYSSWKDYQLVKLNTNTYPANTYSMASNLATGTLPSVHGIVGGSWIMPNGERVNAHSSEEGASLAANIADILTQEWAGVSLTVSASSDSPLAAAFAANPQLARANNYGLSLGNGQFSSIYATSGANPLALNDEAFQTIFKAPQFSSFLGANIVSNNNQIVVTVGSATVIFDLSSPADFALFAELGFVYNFLNSIETDSSLSALVGDSVPDFFSFAFASLKGLKEQSDKFAVAMSLVDNAVQQAIARIDTLYNGRAVSAVACLDTQTVVSDKLKSVVYNSARNSLRSKEDFDTHFPSLYLSNGNSQTCSKVKSAVGTSATVHCFASSYNFVVEENLKASNTTTNDLDVAAFWIFIFFPITLLLIVLTGVVGLCNAGIEASKDSLLFRAAGRHH